MHRALHLLLRFLLFLVPLTALVVVGFVVVSFVSAQLNDVPEPARVALLRPASEQPLDLQPATIEQRLLGLYLRTQEAAIDTPASSTDARKVFSIDPGETALSVSTRLEEEGYIKDGNLFRLYMRYNGIDQKLAAGDFEISPAMTMSEIADRLQRAHYEEVNFTVPEGMRAEEVAELLDVKGVMDGSAFLAMVQGGSVSAKAIGGYEWLPPGLTTLEGYLFPDTYRLPVPAQPSDLLKRMLDNFQAKVTEDTLAAAGQAGRGLEQVIIMASIIEREAPRADERPLVASVYWNRGASGACSKETGGAYLQADPTVQYAAGRAGQWWWKPPSVEAYATVQSPYNTYLRAGLPPAAIASPGISAIQAAIKPADTKYCFFVASGDGGHVFATTLAEHQQNIGKYQK